MKYRPILFTTDMVRAILDGNKTQTRRIKYKCDVGDILWVRETWALSNCRDVVYKADLKDKYGQDYNSYEARRTLTKWKSPYHLTREACRLYLQVESVREERLQWISHNDISAEGVVCEEYIKAREAEENEGCTIPDEIYDKIYDKMNGKFADLWDSINAKRGYGWDTNPLVKVIEFRRHDG